MNQTQKLASDLHHRLKAQIGKKALVIALEGPLGSGKTTFTKAFAQAMGVPEVVVSPTFILHEEYGQFDHIDLWRIEDPQELVALGLGKMIAAKRVIVIEWAEKAEKLIKIFSKKEVKLIWIKFKYGQRENERVIEWQMI